MKTKTDFRNKSNAMFYTVLAAIFLSTGCKKEEVTPNEIIPNDLALMSTTSSSSSYIYANDYGAKADDSQSDNAAINRAIRYADEKGIDEVRFRPGTYVISGTILMRSGVTLNGLDKEKVKLKGASSANGFTFINLVSVNNSGLKNLYLDGNALTRKSTRGNMAISITQGSSYNLIENLTITNFGSPRVSGNFVTISADEGLSKSTSNNTIRNCLIVDPNGYCQFGIRLWTNWLLNKRSSDYTSLVSNNIIDNCQLTGFTWNLVEMAGPGTVRNKVMNSRGYNSVANTGFDIDKGASYNELSNNVVENLGAKTAEATYAFRCQGLKRSSPYDRLAVGNKIRNNTARNIRNTTSSSKSGGILIFHSEETDVTGNRISDVKYGSTKNVAGIWINGAKDLVIKDNIIEKVHFGIYVIGGSTNSNIDIIGNEFSYMETAYKSFKAGAKVGFTFIDNVLKQSGIRISSTDERTSTFKY